MSQPIISPNKVAPGCRTWEAFSKDSKYLSSVSLFFVCYGANVLPFVYISPSTPKLEVELRGVGWINSTATESGDLLTAVLWAGSAASPRCSQNCNRAQTLGECKGNRAGFLPRQKILRYLREASVCIIS